MDLGSQFSTFLTDLAARKARPIPAADVIEKAMMRESAFPAPEIRRRIASMT